MYLLAHTIRVWYIHEWLIFMANVSKHTVHGWYGNVFSPLFWIYAG